MPFPIILKALSNKLITNFVSYRLKMLNKCKLKECTSFNNQEAKPVKDLDFKKRRSIQMAS